jgi:hypothetical protein
MNLSELSADRAGGEPAPLITLPIVLIALLRFSAFSVHLSRARDGSSTWYFRFSPKAVLQVRDEGDWRWRQGTERWRRLIAPFLVRAEALLATACDADRSSGSNVDGAERPGSAERPTGSLTTPRTRGRAPAIDGVGL